MNNRLIAAASFSPKSLVFPGSWVGHIPFAAFLIESLNPKVFVELGTHTGNSYFAFCQSVKTNKQDTKCYAVDTWMGDEQAGLYNDEIYLKVNEHNIENYDSFSTLLRMTFDEALNKFENGSVNLLHIDGLHTYEAVKHDYETWLPKMAPGGVIIFHDTQVFEENFGVHRLWRELQELYPNNIEFTHSHGLGVLQLNDVPDSKKLFWLLPDYKEKQNFIVYFAALGSRIDCQQNIENLKTLLTQRDEYIIKLEHIADVLEKIYASKSWRVTRPFRFLERCINRFFENKD